MGKNTDDPFSSLLLILGWLFIFAGGLGVNAAQFGFRTSSGDFFWMGVITPAILATFVVGFFVWINYQMNADQKDN